MTTFATTALDALRAVDFDWSTRLQDVWRDSSYDVAELHAKTRREFSAKLEQMKRAGQCGEGRSPLGWVLVGRGGSGKTHLLSELRREAVRQNAGFVLVDMTDVHDFWDTLLQGYLDSLQEAYSEGKYQHQVLVANLIAGLGPKNDIAAVMELLAKRKSAKLAEDIERVLRVLHHRSPRQTMQARDAVRALICLNSLDYGVCNTGMAWLQGQVLEPEICRELGFQKSRETPREIVRSLSWLMSLSGPTVVAFDQLDPIVHQVGRHRLDDLADASDEQRTAWSIIEQIGGGLGAMVETTVNTLSIVSCVESTWSLLNELVLKTYQDRFDQPVRLANPERTEVFEAMIQARLGSVYTEQGFGPPYATFPFLKAAIAGLTHETPRDVLKLCEAHRKRCLEAGEVSELKSFTSAASGKTDGGPKKEERLAHLDELYKKYQHQAAPDELLEEKYEDERLAPLFQAALQCLVHEHEEKFSGDIDAQVDREFSGGKHNKPLHARLRLVFPHENSREEHYCVRALQRKNHSAYKTRLKAAMTQSGIDKALNFRRLTIVRAGDPPGGAETQKLTEQFLKAGGVFLMPTEDVLRALSALNRLMEEKQADLTEWLQSRRPVTQLGLGDVLAPAALWKAPLKEDSGDDDSRAASGKQSETQDHSSTVEKGGKGEKAGEQQRGPVNASASPADGLFPVGNRILGLDKPGDVVTLKLPLLSRHTMILGGSGSGKSVTVRRFVEEAALLGVPSIIIDCAHDMSLFDERWSTAPPAWRDGDAELARRFHAETEMIVWTPGREGGNPLSLAPLPDFRPLVDDPEELEASIQMVCDGLGEIVAAGNSQRARNKQGLLTQSLRFFAVHFPEGSLQDYVALLDTLPAEAGLGLRQESNLASEMADSLKVEIANNPLLRSAGAALDPAVLFGDDRPGRGKTRVSVINLLGLRSDKMQFSFLNQLAMTLFSWIKKNPKPPDNRPLRGLLVIDEAKDYVPSLKSTECKQSIMRLAAQARKYRLGLVFATQHPKDIDTKIVGNCATHLYGLNNSPASLDTLRDLMQQKGGSGDDIPKLKKGQFYVHNADAGHQQPIKVKIPMSLSRSPDSPLEEGQILEKARASRQQIGNGSSPDAE